MKRVAVVLGALAATALAVFVVLLLIFGSQVQYAVEHRLEIEAPAERVWEILAATDAYPQWNPYLLEIVGPVRPGETISATLSQRTWKEPLTVHPVVVTFEPRELRWRGRVGIPGILDTDHSFVVEAIGDERSLVIQREEFRGLLARILRERAPDIQKATHESFVKMNEALKGRAEQPRL
ncbi:MAG: SRPBCC domain-containing protein [Candidatus Binatia bacterium]|nr:SRPBCC domain-containing protein [Candidatus Binatia bacterium]